MNNAITEKWFDPDLSKHDNDVSIAYLKDKN